MRTRYKILIPMAAVAVTCAVVIGMIGVIVLRTFVNHFNRQQLSIAHTVAETIIDDCLSNAQYSASTAAENSQLIEAVQNGDAEALADISAAMMEAAGMDFFTITDARGIVLERAHEPSQRGDSLVHQISTEHALGGSAYTTLEQGATFRLAAISTVPIYHENGQLLGTLRLGYRLDQNDFVDHIKSLTETEVSVFLGDTPVATTIADENGQRSMTQAEPDISNQVLEGSPFSGRVNVHGAKLLSHYSPLRNGEDTPLGMLYVGLDTAAFDGEMIRTTWFMAGITLLLGILSVLVSQWVAGRISRPIIEISAWARRLAEGDVNLEVMACPKVSTRDELCILTRDFREMVATIKEQATTLSAIAEGDYSVSIPVRSKHDIINQAINRLLEQNNQILSEINLSALQVSAGSAALAAGAQSLAQASGVQSASIEELSSTISELAGTTKENAHVTKEAAALSISIRDHAEDGTTHLDRMMKAVEDINQSGEQIESVIKVIENIAFQTKILALNASVEAAQAGRYGKGFAVVAEEVGTLAAKSAEAAKNTNRLIEESIEKSKLGLQIVGATSASLKGIIGDINSNAGMIAQIAQSSDAQAAAISQIGAGIEEMASVLRQNNITVENSAAASQEMNGQSQLLTRLIARFKLKDSASLPLGTGCGKALPSDTPNRRGLRVLEPTGRNKALRF